MNYLLSNKKKKKKRDELLIHETVWMNFKSFMLKSQTQKSTYCMIPFLWHFGKGKTVGTAIRLVVV